MEYRNIDITIVSAEGLKKVTLLSKMQPYAVVYVVDPHIGLRTQVDKQGGTNPAWNQRLSLPVSDALFHKPGSFLNVVIWSKGSLMGDKLVGKASIPLSQLLQESNREETMKTCPLRRSSFEVTGAVRLSIHVCDKLTTQAVPFCRRGPPSPCPQRRDQMNFFCGFVPIC
ncbi:hypothetical protein KP509_20G084600 [Ceratopteris richardii]|uniref:C2 domain-containing protein n=1 Tax=Ceratopteris richardii TaxID=49495 RepID=A0A8T2SGV8_CERRI|nr:hypothetical protein KP509_20G084600 [Ceratopteris richardii]